MQPAGTLVGESWKLYSTMPTAIVAVGFVHVVGGGVVVVVVDVVVVVVDVVVVVVVVLVLVLPPPPPPPPPPPVTVSLPVIAFPPPVHVHLKRPADLKTTNLAPWPRRPLRHRRLLRRGVQTRDGPHEPSALHDLL